MLVSGDYLEQLVQHWNDDSCPTNLGRDIGDATVAYFDGQLQFLKRQTVSRYGWCQQHDGADLALVDIVNKSRTRTGLVPRVFSNK
jgi:hypothetical protein